MGLFDLFTSAPAQQQQPAQQSAQQQQPPTAAAPGNIPDQTTSATQANQATAPNGVVPAGASDSPLEQFKDLWNTAHVDGKEGAANKQQAPTITPEALQQVVSKVDFSKTLTPDMLAKVAAGGEDAQSAFAQAMNQVAQQVMIQSTLVNNKLTEQAVAAAIANQQASIPELLRTQAASDHLKTTNPLFSNPAVKPIIEATQAQLIQKFPQATPAELTKMTQDYILAMGNAFAPQTPVNSNGPQEVDWEAFLRS